MEFTSSAERAKEDNNIKKTMEKIFSRLIDIQERKRQYRKKKNQRVVELRFEGQKIEHKIKCKSNDEAA